MAKYNSKEQAIWKKGFFSGLFKSKKKSSKKIFKNNTKSNSARITKPKKQKSGFNSLNDVPNWCKHNVLFDDARYKGLYINFSRELGFEHETARDMALDVYKKQFGDSVLKEHYDL